MDFELDDEDEDEDPDDDQLGLVFIDEYLEADE